MYTRLKQDACGALHSPQAGLLLKDADAPHNPDSLCTRLIQSRDCVVIASVHHWALSLPNFWLVLEGIASEPSVKDVCQGQGLVLWGCDMGARGLSGACLRMSD